MHDAWRAEIALELPAATALIWRAFPAFAELPVRALAQGWDSAAFTVDDGGERPIVVRIPRRQMGAECLQAELDCVPELAPLLPLPISAPTYVGIALDDFPWPIAGYRMLAGTPADEAAKTPDFRARSAAGLGRFLRALHDLPTSVGQPLGDTIGRMDLPRRRQKVEDRLLSCSVRVPSLPWADVRALLDALVTTPPWAGPPRWAHGDLYCRHLLLEDDGRLCGVIDFGDVHLGDPAVDLSCAATCLPTDAHAAFFAAYGEVDDATWRRAIFRGCYHAICLLDYALSEAIEPLIEATGIELRGAVASWRAIGR